MDKLHQILDSTITNYFSAYAEYSPKATSNQAFDASNIRLLRI